ncbi:MAG: flagellar biosynthetic protein FliQ [Planctomycetota bacterium]|nr:MAG: flagellar biosynthetic protein FliQ [Planctomycetota bacterium]
MDEATIIDLARQTLLLVIKIVTPALVIGMLVGISVSLFQAITSIQEQTLTLVPKMLAVAVALMLLMPWIITMLVEFARDLFGNLTYFAGF